MALLTADDVLNKKFQATKFREGYDQDEVDDFLDEVVNTLRVMTAENEDLKSKLAAAPAPQRLSEPESATGMLQLAQKLHDDYVRAGQEEGERIINEARAQATRIVAEAEETSARTLSALEQERSLLERKIDELRVFERDYRTRLKSYLENLLGDLESRSATVQPRQPGEGPSFNG